MHVRPATPADHDAWLRMRTELWPDCPPEEHAREMAEWLANPAWAVLIAERPDGTPCGFAEVGTRPYADGCDSSPVAYLEGWFVDEGVRRQGYGRALLDAAAAWARGQGHVELASDALLDNEVSHAAHRAGGFEEVDRVIQYRRVL